VTKQVWLPVDGALLKKLREDAGVEITTLARLHSLSTSQIKQLENGGDSSFYTPSIKLATGRKLLMHFGEDVQPLEQVLEQPHSQELETPAKEVHATQDTNDVSGKKISLLNLQIVGAVLVFLSLIYWILFQSVSVIEKEPVIVGKQPTISSPIAAMANETKPISSTALSSVEIHKESPNECKWGNEPTSLFVNQPTKLGDYVHVIANTDGSICVRDATSKVQILHLRSSQSQTIRGRPPFEIFSSNLNEFKLFYQGNLLRLPSSNIKNITLKEQKYE
jgi:DNA-binding XRE family transcriptional regulator